MIIFRGETVGWANRAHTGRGETFAFFNIFDGKERPAEPQIPLLLQCARAIENPANGLVRPRIKLAQLAALIFRKCCVHVIPESCFNSTNRRNEMRKICGRERKLSVITALRRLVLVKNNMFLNYGCAQRHRESWHLDAIVVIRKTANHIVAIAL